MNLNATLLFQVLFFAVFVWFSRKFVWSPIIGALNERKTRIADGLAAAERGQQAEQQGQAEAEKLVAEARARASEIIGKAEQQGVELIAAAKADAKAQGERIKTAAQAEIETEINKAKESLRAQVSELAVAGARQILKKEVDAGVHAELLNKLATRL